MHLHVFALHNGLALFMHANDFSLQGTDLRHVSLNGLHIAEERTHCLPLVSGLRFPVVVSSK
jgi:hypothetical protein